MKLVSKKGHNLNLPGNPSIDVEKIAKNNIIKLHPQDFPGIRPKLLVSEGDFVKKGQPIYLDKKSPNVMFTSFCSGFIDKIIYGERRSILSIDIPFGIDTFLRLLLLLFFDFFFDFGFSN